jgi:SAM-dependent methyltransferase
VLSVESARVSSRPGPGRLATERGRLGDLGQDYERGHLTYVEKLDAGAKLWLRTKPFSAPPNKELAQCLRTFAHLVELLQLDLRAQVLDLGCGPGWLSEFLARCGYWVTGVDISPDMTEIARARVEAIAVPVGEGVEPLAEFHALAVREMPWTSRFDAAVLYDTMHHFDNELETLETVRRTLVPGGQLYIHEGAMPVPGSEAERNLVAEMERFGTLESPFDPEYLVAVVEEAGFVNVRRLAEVDELVELPAGGGRLERLLPKRLRDRAQELAVDFNIVHAINPIPEEDAGRGAFAAEIRAEGAWTEVGPEQSLHLTVTNTGRAFWPAGRYPCPNGSVTLGAYVVGPAQERQRELPRTILPRSVAPGESVAGDLRHRRDDHEGGAVAVDLVREGIFWFSEVGSEPLVLPPATA